MPTGQEFYQRFQPGLLRTTEDVIDAFQRLERSLDQTFRRLISEYFEDARRILSEKPDVGASIKLYGGQHASKADQFEFCQDTSVVASINGSGVFDANVAADFIDTLTEIAAALKQGDGSKLQTVTTAGADGQLAKWDSGGKLADASVTASRLIQNYTMSKTMGAAATSVALDAHVSPARILLILDTDGSASQNLNNITGFGAGDELILRSTANTRNIVLVHNAGGSGQFIHGDLANRTLDTTFQRACYVNDSGAGLFLIGQNF